MTTCNFENNQSLLYSRQLRILRRWTLLHFKHWNWNFKIIQGGHSIFVHPADQTTDIMNFPRRSLVLSDAWMSVLCLEMLSLKSKYFVASNDDFMEIFENVEIAISCVLSCKISENLKFKFWCCCISRYEKFTKRNSAAEYWKTWKIITINVKCRFIIKN